MTIKKQEQIQKAAEGYLFKNNISNADCRFDVISILDKNGKMEIFHIENAF